MLRLSGNCRDAPPNVERHHGFALLSAARYAAVSRQLLMGGKRAAKSQKTFQLSLPHRSGIANRRKQFSLIGEHYSWLNVMKVGGGFLHGQQEEKSSQHKTGLCARRDSDPGHGWRDHSIIKEKPT